MEDDGDAITFNNKEFTNKGTSNLDIVDPSSALGLGSSTANTALELLTATVSILEICNFFPRANVRKDPTRPTNSLVFQSYAD